MRPALFRGVAELDSSSGSDDMAPPPPGHHPPGRHHHRHHNHHHHHHHGGRHGAVPPQEHLRAWRKAWKQHCRGLGGGHASWLAAARSGGFGPWSTLPSDPQPPFPPPGPPPPGPPPPHHHHHFGHPHPPGAGRPPHPPPLPPHLGGWPGGFPPPPGFPLPPPHFGSDTNEDNMEGPASGMVLKIDIKETVDAYTVVADLPGVPPEQVEVQLQADAAAGGSVVLSIAGHRELDTWEEPGSLHLEERGFGAFKRRFRLPADASAEAALADHKLGVLTITIPKGPDGAIGSRAALTVVEVRSGELLQPPAAPPLQHSGRHLLQFLLCKALDALLQLWPEVADETLDGPCSCIPKRTNGVTLYLFGDLLQHVNLLEARVTGLHALQDLPHPGRALTAGRALAAALVLVKVGQARDRVHHVGALVHDDDGGSAQARLHGLEGVKVHEHVVADGLGQQRHGRAAGDDGEQVVPAAAHSAGVALNELA
eukprot:SM000555S17871  [mRNA]  locus=s555:433:3088:- [translate_table: standard]